MIINIRLGELRKLRGEVVQAGSISYRVPPNYLPFLQIACVCEIRYAVTKVSVIQFRG